MMLAVKQLKRKKNGAYDEGISTENELEKGVKWGKQRDLEKCKKVQRQVMCPLVQGEKSYELSS